MITTSEQFYRDAAKAWCEFATRGVGGRLANDPVYRWITEGRDKGPTYSSCADLGHWLLYRLGVRCAFINRTEHNGWRPVVNVARLCARPLGSCPVARRPHPGEALLTGDIIISWARPDSSDAHVMVVNDLDDLTLRTWDLGQGPMVASAWANGRQHIEAARRSRRAWWSGGELHLQNGKIVRSIISLPEALHFARTNDELAPADAPTGERLDELEGWIDG
jgi:hypothetical protein